MLFPEDQIWMIVIGFIVAFVLAFGIGANDVANSFGTSVGSKVLTLKQACFLATICETLGAVLLGAKVSDTIRKGIIDPNVYANMTSATNESIGPQMLMLGQVAALSGSCVWLLVATFFRVPVSGTHSIVGATIGFALVVHGSVGVNWKKLGMIVGSWFISPVMSGGVSVFLYFVIDRLVIRKKDPMEPGLRILPIVYGVAIVVNLFSIFYGGPPLLKFDKIPLYGVFILSFGIGIIVAVLIKFLAVPWQRREIIREVNNNPDNPDFHPDICDSQVILKAQSEVCQKNLNNIEENDHDILPHKSVASVNSNKVDRAFEITSAEDLGGKTIHEGSKKVQIVDENPESIKRSEIKDRPEQALIFAKLQIMTAIFGSFAHGGNDVSNAIGPLIGLWLIGINQDVVGKAPSPIWILFYGGFGISVGLWVWGRRVIQTLGEDLTKITPSSGVCIELGAAITVLIASNIGIPISTTHCKVGSVVAVGYFRSRDNVNWSIFRNILLAWLVTLPASGGISALLQFSLQMLITG